MVSFEIKFYIIYKQGKRLCLQSGLSADEALKNYIKSWVNSGYYINIEDYTSSEVLDENT